MCRVFCFLLVWFVSFFLFICLHCSALAVYIIRRVLAATTFRVSGSTRGGHKTSFSTFWRSAHFSVSWWGRCLVSFWYLLFSVALNFPAKILHSPVQHRIVGIPRRIIKYYLIDDEGEFYGRWSPRALALRNG